MTIEEKLNNTQRAVGIKNKVFFYKFELNKPTKILNTLQLLNLFEIKIMNY